MTDVICRGCGKTFRSFPSQERKFCSKPCFYKKRPPPPSIKDGMVFYPCPSCSGGRWEWPSQITGKKICCSRACAIAIRNKVSGPERLAQIKAKAKLSSSGCWLWPRLLHNGYGQTTWNSKPWRTHRLVWTLVNGPIPKGLLVLHRCDVRNCCNPDHLFLGTAADNTADMMAKGRGRPGGRRYEGHTSKGMGR